MKKIFFSFIILSVFSVSIFAANNVDYDKFCSSAFKEKSYGKVRKVGIVDIDTNSKKVTIREAYKNKNIKNAILYRTYTLDLINFKYLLTTMKFYKERVDNYNSKTSDKNKVYHTNMLFCQKEQKNDLSGSMAFFEKYVKK